VFCSFFFVLAFFSRPPPPRHRGDNPTPTPAPDQRRRTGLPGSAAAQPDSASEAYAIAAAGRPRYGTYTC
jgi:hypothetical protein